MVDGEDDPDAEKPEKKAKKKRGDRKKQKKLEKADFKNDKDYQLFLQDIEDDEEFRSKMNLYKDTDVIAQLESQIKNMSLDDKPSESEFKKKLGGGELKVDGQEREVKKAKRRTDAGKEKEKDGDKARIHE